MPAAVVNCKACQKRMVVLLDNGTVPLRPHAHVFACPSCGRLKRRTLDGVLLRVVRADEDQSDDC